MNRSALSVLICKTFSDANHYTTGYVNSFYSLYCVYAFLKSSDKYFKLYIMSAVYNYFQFELYSVTYIVKMVRK